METDAASANPQRGYRLLQDTCLAAAETAPELRAKQALPNRPRYRAHEPKSRWNRAS